MAQVTIKYGVHSVSWSDVDHLNTVTSAAALSATLTNSEVVIFKTYDSQEEAQAAHDSLLAKVTEALGSGGTTIIIDIDDL